MTEVNRSDDLVEPWGKNNLSKSVQLLIRINVTLQSFSSFFFLLPLHPSVNSSFFFAGCRHVMLSHPFTPNLVLPAGHSKPSFAGRSTE